MAQWPGGSHLRLVTATGRQQVGVGPVSPGRCTCSGPRPSRGRSSSSTCTTAAAGLLGITDFAWREHGLLGEFDGKVKYQPLSPAGEDPGDAVFREKQREDQLRRVTGWSMVPPHLGGSLRPGSYGGVRALADAAGRLNTCVRSASYAHH